jgi:DNA-binding CsgD family transcriptional regulator
MSRRNYSDEAIVREIYSSILQRERWASLFLLLRKSFVTTFSVVLARNRAHAVNHIIDIDYPDQRQQQAYETYYCKLNPPTGFAMTGLTVGKVFTDIHYADHRDYLRSELYNDFFCPLHAEHMAFLYLGDGPAGQTSLVLRRSRAAGPYDQIAVKRLRRLAAHLSNRENILSRMNAINFGSANFSRISDQLRVCAFIVDRASRVLCATNEGEEILRDGRLALVQAGELCLREPRIQHAFEGAVRDCADSFDRPEKDVCRVLRLRSADNSAATSISVSATTWTDASGTSRPACLVVLEPHSSRSDEIARNLGEAYGLTPAERRVVTALCDGRQLTHYAQTAGLSVQTVRTLLKRAMEKTDTHTQAQLVSIAFRNHCFDRRAL